MTKEEHLRAAELLRNFAELIERIGSEASPELLALEKEAKGLARALVAQAATMRGVVHPREPFEGES